MKHCIVYFGAHCTLHGPSRATASGTNLLIPATPPPAILRAQLRAYYNLIIQGKISADGTVAAGAILPGDLMGTTEQRMHMHHYVER